MIAKITAFEIRTYTDNETTVAYCEWVDGKGKRGRTEGKAPAKSEHMQALLFRALEEGVQPEFTTW